MNGRIQFSGTVVHKFCGIFEIHEFNLLKLNKLVCSQKLVTIENAKEKSPKVLNRMTWAPNKKSRRGNKSCSNSTVYPAV